MSSSSPKGLFIIGTDTGVGKTLVSALVIRYLHSQGQKVAPMKPFESGSLKPFDSELLWQACDPKNRPKKAPWQVCPYHFHLPLAPEQAAVKEKRKVSLSRVKRAFKDLRKEGVLIVEGCGGLLVPLLPQNPTFTVEKLAQQFKLPILIVARAGLGTLNHTLLTLKRCEASRLKVLGIVLNTTVALPKTEYGPDRSIDLNRATLKRLTKIPVWGPLPFHGIKKRDFKSANQAQKRLAKTPEARAFLKDLYSRLLIASR